MTCGLRDYGTAAWEGGDAGCEHRSPTMREGRNEDRPKLAGSDSTNAAQLLLAARSNCGRCGAVRLDQQIGLEETPAAYVERLVELFREVRRVLRPDGTVWLNLGDSYAANRGYQVVDTKHREVGNDFAMSVPFGLKPKDLIGIPWRVAFALQADGWWLRSEITWCKRAPMPESVTDRPTSATEKVFLLAKAERYFYDADAVREPHSRDWTGAIGANNYKVGGVDDLTGLDRNGTSQEGLVSANPNPAGRNARNWWLLGPEPAAFAHYAVFPTEIPRRAILAGCPPDGVVLDPFVGSGTTCMVATSLGRRSIGIDLNAEYLDLAVSRNLQLGMELAL